MLAQVPPSPTGMTHRDGLSRSGAQTEYFTYKDSGIYLIASVGTLPYKETNFRNQLSNYWWISLRGVVQTYGLRNANKEAAQTLPKDTRAEPALW